MQIKSISSQRRTPCSDTWSHCGIHCRGSVFASPDALPGGREIANQVKYAANLKQIGVALQAYADVREHRRDSAKSVNLSRFVAQRRLL
jgi:hypothetical protein